jgi:hypothetical protein
MITRIEKALKQNNASEIEKLKLEILSKASANYLMDLIDEYDYDENQSRDNETNAKFLNFIRDKRFNNILSGVLTELKKSVMEDDTFHTARANKISEQAEQELLDELFSNITKPKTWKIVMKKHSFQLRNSNCSIYLSVGINISIFIEFGKDTTHQGEKVVDYINSSNKITICEIDNIDEVDNIFLDNDIFGIVEKLYQKNININNVSNIEELKQLLQE